MPMTRAGSTHCRPTPSLEIRYRAFLPLGERLEDRTLLSGGTTNAAVAGSIPLKQGPSGLVSGTIVLSGTMGADGQATFPLDPTTGDIAVSGGRLVVSLAPLAGIQVTLRQAASGAILIESDAPPPGGSGVRIDMHVAAVTQVDSGVAPLELELSGPPGEPFQATVSFTPATAPGAPLPGTGTGQYAPLLAADLNGDGIPDLATPGGVYLGLGDGTFQPVPGQLLLATPGGDPSAMVSSTLLDDGHLDIAITDAQSGEVSIFAGRGNGTFAPPILIPVPGAPVALAAAEFDGDGRVDLAVVSQTPGQVEILRNLGAGIFRPEAPILLADYTSFGQPQSIAVGHFGAGHGPVDLAIACGETPGGQPGGLLIFPGAGDGSFGVPQIVAAGLNPVSVVAADLNGDGLKDLVVADQGDISQYADFSNFSHVSALLKLGQIAEASATSSPGGLVVLLGKSNGTFTAEPEVSAGFLPQSVLVGDFNGDNRPDVVVLHGLSIAATLFLGNGQGGFAPPIQVVPAYPASSFSPGPVYRESIVAADFNGDGRLDLALASSLSSVVPVLLGDGDGRFQGQGANATGDAPISVAVGDFNGDGIPDLAVVDAFSSQVTILLGRGDGSFVAAPPLTTPAFPTSVAIADLNGDGRKDLVVTEAGSASVTVFLGNGDGTFVKEGQLSVGSVPTSVVACDLNGDGIPDLAVADAGSHSVTVLMGLGGGLFAPPVSYPVGQEPVSIAAGNFERNGRPDLVIADAASNDIFVLRNLGEGVFGQAVPIPVGQEPDGVAVADLNRDGTCDVAVCSASGSVTVLLGEGNSDSWNLGVPPLRALPAIRLQVPKSDPISLTIGDFGNNGVPDIAVADAGNLLAGSIDLLLGAGDGTFPTERDYAEGSLPVSIASGSFLHNGRDDLAVSLLIDNSVDVRINQNGSFNGGAATATAADTAPLVGDFQGDGTTGVVSLDAQGHLLFRSTAFQNGLPLGFGSSIQVNRNQNHQKYPSMGIALLPGSPTPLIASLDGPGQRVDLFSAQGKEFVLVGELAVPAGTSEIFAEGTSPNGIPRLLAVDPQDGSISVLDVGGGVSGPMSGAGELFVDPGLSDIVALPGTGAIPTMIASNQLNGEVQVLTASNHFLDTMPRYAAGTGLSEYSPTGAGSSNNVTSLQGATALSLGKFGPAGGLGLATISPGSDQLNLLQSLGGGRYGDPVSFATAGAPLAIGAGDLLGNRLDDIAVLEPGEVQVFLADGGGGFFPGMVVSISAGFDPTSLRVVSLDAGGLPDLIVSNPFGDLLLFVNQGNGSFVTPPPPLPLTKLASTPTGWQFAIADPLHNAVVVRSPGPTAGTTLADISSGLLDPGPPVFADLNGDCIPDLIFADGGGDQVCIYLGVGNGLYRSTPIDFAVGTDPVGITVASLQGSQNPPDLIVANEGSNDISILLGRGQGADWTLIDGPRLRVGAGPVATSLMQPTPGAPPELVVSEALASDVRFLPSAGDGFFKDLNPHTVLTGRIPGPPVIVSIGSPQAPQQDVAVPDAGSNTISLINGLTLNATTLPSEGTTPVDLLSVDSTLLVANEEDGHLGLLQLDESGNLLSADFLTDPELPHLSSLALAERLGISTLFATSEGFDSAFPLDLAGPPAVPLSSTSVPGPRAESTSSTVPEGSDIPASFSPEASQVAALAAGAGPSEEASTNGLAPSPVAIVATLAMGLGQPRPSGTGPGSNSGSDDPDLTGRAPGDSGHEPPTPAEFADARYIEEALEDLRGRIRERLFPVAAQEAATDEPATDAQSPPERNPMGTWTDSETDRTRPAASSISLERTEPSSVSAVTGWIVESRRINGPTVAIALIGASIAGVVSIRRSARSPGGVASTGARRRWYRGIDGPTHGGRSYRDV